MIDPYEIGIECTAQGLISPNDFDKIRSRSGVPESVRNTDLLKLLRDTGNNGYRVFKKILDKPEWRKPHRYGNFLEKIHEKEEEVLKFVQGA